MWEILWGRPDDQTPVDVHEFDLPIADLPKPFVGLRMTLLSDLHFGPIVKAPYAARIVRLVNETRPDLILILGDLVERNRWNLAPCAAVIAGLRARLGVLGCLGNHDFRAGAKRAAAAYRSAGVDVLRNAHRRIRLDGAELVIAGVDDPSIGRADLAAGLDGVDGRKPVILLAHSPDIAEDLDGAARVDLLVSGHSHGGQIRLFGRAPLTALRHRRYVAGLVEGPRCPVYTTRGVGFTRLPVRVDCRPEIPTIRLIRPG